MSSNGLNFITIRGFKSIASIERLGLRRINVLIGPNGSGKSSFLEAFRLLQAIRGERLTEYVAVAGGAEKLLHFGSKVTSAMWILLWFHGGGLYELSLAPTTDDNLVALRKRLSPEDTSAGNVVAESVEPGYRHTTLGGRLANLRVYHFNDTSASSPMRKTAKLDDNRSLRSDGSNLASFLYFLRAKHPDAYGLVQRAVQKVAPFFHDFELQPRQLNPDDIKLEWRHKSSDQYFDASSLSDGTLRFIALATLFLQPEEYRPPVILVDEPELGLHPYAIEMMASLVRQASVKTQVIVATQSSLLLDYFSPEDVLVANRVDGGTQLTRLKSEQLAAWLEDYSLGQLWEKNELGGRPAPE